MKTVTLPIEEYEERMQRMLAMSVRPNSMPTSNPAPVDLPRQLELEFVE